MQTTIHTITWWSMDYSGHETRFESPCECFIGHDHDEQEFYEMPGDS